MRTVLNVLKEKLNTLGYNEAIASSVLSKFDLALIENSNVDVENISDFITVEEYDEPNVEIIRMYLNVNNDILQCEVLEGDIQIYATESAIGTRFAVADYTLSKRSAIIGITNEFKVKIILYKPSTKIQNLYSNLTYEKIYKKERDDVTLAYYEPFLEAACRNGRATERKVREIFALLVSDFVIDEIAIKDLNPRFKMYDNEYKYAENLYSYSLRYINVKNNRVEFLEKDANIKMLSKNVQTGMVTNDPYIKVDKLGNSADFPLNTVSYYWVEGSRSVQEQIAIFLSPRVYEQGMFSELVKEDPKIENLARDLARAFKRDSNQDVDYEDIRDVLKKLNLELMFPSTDIIRLNLSNKMDQIEPIKYKYKLVTDPAEFESMLYISIEDHMSKRYKYKLVENVLEDLTTIGNKLEYTDEKGFMVRKQSVADFNVNAPTVIIKRETFIGAEGIPDLLGYIYEDMKYYGTDGLPVPNIEVVFYMPPIDCDRSTAVMYNGTSLEFSLDNISRQNFFNSDQMSSNSYVIGGEVLPGSTRVTVRYVNSRGETLKENVIGNVFPKTSFLPDLIPIINDKEGKEWILENPSVLPTVLSADADANVIELRYIEKYARVSVCFINREGKKIAEDKQEIIQVGTNYDFDAKKFCKDFQGDEWKLMNARPSKLIVSENDDKNKIILIYDIERVDVVINYINKMGVAIAESKVVQAPIEKLYKAEVLPFIIDSNGLGWSYIEGSNCTVLVKNYESNEITLVYEEAKRKVITRIKNLQDVPLVDDEIIFLQVGKKHSVKFESNIMDFECKEWIYTRAVTNEIIVSEDESKNILEAIYEPRLSRVAIKFISTDGRQIRESAINQAQVGARFNAESLREIPDSFGKYWAAKETGRGIVISEDERENAVTLMYEPMMSKVTVKYFDSESNELIPPKYETLQVGTEYKNDPMIKIVDDGGKHWIIDKNKVPTITVKKQPEENVISIYYEKETTGVTITFYDAYSNKLREEQIVEGQIGAVYDSNLFLKISDMQGTRWMLESTEPKKLMVKEKENNFKFIYGEVKAKVLVKHLNVNTQKAIVEDVVTTVKLGGIFVPNIRQKVLDKNKYQWKYIGDENISIVTKENEQENIIILNYDEDKAEVILKYQNQDEETIRNDAVKQVQIGREMKLEPIPKFNDTNGLGWKYTKASNDSIIVKADDNVIISFYEPLKAKVHTKYLKAENKDVIPLHEDILQVGKKFVPKILEKVSDSNDYVWKFIEVSAKEIIVKEELNIIECKYEELLSEVTVNYLGEEGELIADPMKANRQVGTIVETKIEQNFTDKEDKAWIFGNIDNKKLKVQEDSTKNIINVSYKKEMVEVKLCYFGSGLQTIRESNIIKAQIGSIYIDKPDKIIIDKKGLGWDVIVDMIPKFKVKRDPAENIVNISYDKYLIDTTVRFLDDDGKDVIKPSIIKNQVGISFLPKIDNYIDDEEGKEWVYALRVTNKIFTTAQKVEPIIIKEDSAQNLIKLQYKPSLNKVFIKYKDPMGNDIKLQTETEAQIGSMYTPEIPETIISAGNVKWSYNPNSKSQIKVDKDSSKNIVNLAYEEEKAPVVYIYRDEDNNELKEKKKQLVQIGNIHKVSPENVIESEDGRVWEYKAKSLDEIKVDEKEENNIVEIVYSPLNVEVTLEFVTLNGNTIMPSKIIKAQLGSEFKAPYDKSITDENSQLYKFIKMEPDTIKVKEIPLGHEENTPNDINVFKLTYESSFAEVRILFKDVDGHKLREDEVKQMHVGNMFEPTPIQYITDTKGIQWELVSEKVDPIRVMEDERLNQITMVYEVAKAEVSVRYKDMDGNIIKDAKLFELEIGSEFIPEIDEELEDSKNRVWTYVMTEPIKLTVGSINNIVNIVYKEKKVMTTVKIQTTDGKPLKDDIKTKQQIGSIYSPPPVTKVVYDSSNNIWRYAYNSPSEITVSENPEDNVIIQYYTDDNAVREETPTNKFNPDISKFIDKELVEQAEKEEAEKEKQKQEEEARKQAMAAEEVKFTDQYLINLERNIPLNNSEKATINDLNDHNTEIMKLLHGALDLGENIDSFGLEEKLEKIIREEKQLVEKGLSAIISEDRTGSKILKIFEAITSSEMIDKDFSFLQRKKAILFAEYFTNSNVAEIDEVTYIVERGKNTKSLEVISKKIPEAISLINKKKPDTQKLVDDLIKQKVVLIYEKIMLNHYYHARSLVKDEYFTNEESKKKMSNEIIVAVANALPNRAVKLFEKTLTLSAAKRIELEAVMKLLNQPQYTTVTNAINKFTDSKTRKFALRLFNEITGEGKK